MTHAWTILQHQSRNHKIANLAAGDLVKVKSDIVPFIHHDGIVFEENGQRFVYHNTPDFLNMAGGSIVREPLDKWIKNREIVRIEPTGITTEEIHEIVKKQKGKKYDFLNFNCEHFTHYIKEKRYMSPQVAKWGVAIAIISVSYLIYRKTR